MERRLGLVVWIKDIQEKHTRDIVSLQDRYTRLNNSIVFPVDHDHQFRVLKFREVSKKHKHITHGYHIIYLLDTEPMQYIRHQGLETHVLDTCDELC